MPVRPSTYFSFRMAAMLRNKSQRAENEQARRIDKQSEDEQFHSRSSDAAAAPFFLDGIIG
jgi:hypothetical protein